MNETFGPRITVLTATYNRLDLLPCAIESFMSQGYPNKELVICDDCSTDGSWEYLSSLSHPQIRVLRNDTNRGFIRTMNWLFSIADGDFICICDSDDWMESHKIRHQLKMIEKYDADCVISELITVRTDGSRIPHPPTSEHAYVISPNGKETWPTGTIFMKREVLRHVRGYHEYFADCFCGDIYFIQLIKGRFRMVYDPEHVYNYRLSPGSMTQTFDLYKLAKLRIAHTLVEQRITTGTDLLEQENYAALETLLQAILKDRVWRSEQYRMYAARQIDERCFAPALMLLARAIYCSPLNVLNWRTTFYFIRKLFRRS